MIGLDDIAIANALITGLEKLLPRIKSMVERGEVPVEDQQQVFGRYNALKSNVPEAFSGPEWKPSHQSTGKSGDGA